MVNRKQQVKKSKEVEFHEQYNGPPNPLYLMEHFIDDRILTMEEEIELVKNADRDFDRRICLEETRFKLSDQHYTDSFDAFSEYLKPILNEAYFKDLKVCTGKFVRGELHPNDLFGEFYNAVGPVLAYKYFFLYTATVQRPEQKRALEALLMGALRLLPLRNPSSIEGCKTWEDFFGRVRLMILNEILLRIDNKSIDLTKKYAIHPDRMFQLVGSVRGARFQDLIHWKYLNNFFEQTESKQTLQRAMLVPKDKIQHLMAKLSNLDVLISFAYFDYAMKKLSAESRKQTVNLSTNPNLLKIFMRTNEKFAKENRFKIDSDDEDYAGRVIVQTPVETPTLLAQVSRPFKSLMSEMPDVTQKTEYDRFKAKNQPQAAKKEMQYQNEATDLQRIEQSFPALQVEDDGENLFSRMGAKRKVINAGIKKAEISKPQPQQQLQAKPVSFPSKKETKRQQDVKSQQANIDFMFKNSDDESTGAQSLKTFSKPVDFEADFPPLDGSAPVVNRLAQDNSFLKFTKPKPDTGSTFNKYSIKPGDINEEEDFPELEDNDDGDNIFARMKQKKPAKVSKVKQRKEQYITNSHPLTQPEVDSEAIDKRSKKKQNKIAVDPQSHYYANRPNIDPKLPDFLKPLPENDTEPLPSKKPKLDDFAFPELSQQPQKTAQPEPNLFQKMQQTKSNPVQELAQKFGYSAAPEPSSSTASIPIVGKKKRK